MDLMVLSIWYKLAEIKKHNSRLGLHMLKKTYAAASIAILLTACAQTSAPEFATYEGERIEIAATATPNLFNSDIIITINGNTVIDDKTETFGGSSQTFTGNWQGKQVTARLTQVTNMFSNYVQVDGFIDGDHVETLTI